MFDEKETFCRDYWEEGGRRPEKVNRRGNRLFWLFMLLLLLMFVLAVRPALADDPFYQQMQQYDQQNQMAADAAVDADMAREREDGLRAQLRDQINGTRIDEMTGLPARLEPNQHQW